MSNRIDDFDRPKLGATAADLGEEAYRENLRDHPGPDPGRGNPAGTVPAWKAPNPKNLPPGEHRGDAQEVKVGQDLKEQGGVRRRPGTSEAPQ